MGVQEMDPLSQLSLPPGFRFYPTDEELLVQYLCRKVAGYQFSLPIIGEIDLYKFDPWVLPGKATFGDKEWYFFSPRDRKYPNGSRPNRVAGSGYWKATGTDKIITTKGRRVGIKKALVFYMGKAPKGTKTNWIMHEYRLSLPPRKIGSAKLDDWVLCRIYEKNSSGQKPILGETSSKEHSHGSPSSSSQFDDVLESLPEINDGIFNLPQVNSLKNVYHDEKLNIQNLTSGNFDWASLAGIASLPDLVPGSQAQGLISSNMYDDNDIYVPSVMPHMDSFCDKFRSADNEVQSGIRAQRFDKSGLSGGFASSLDPFRIRYPYPTQSGGGFGLIRQ